MSLVYKNTADLLQHWQKKGYVPDTLWIKHHSESPLTSDPSKPATNEHQTN